MATGWSRAEIGTTGSACLVLLAAFACSSATAGPRGSARPEPAVFRLDVAGQPDSALKLAKFALGAIDGTVQLPQVRSSMTSVATHYTRSRRGGGQTQVAVIVAVDRHVADSLAPITQVEVSAWALDLAHQATAGQRRSGFPSTALSTNAPAQRQPRAITPADTADFRALEYVVESLISQGAKRRR